VEQRTITDEIRQSTIEQRKLAAAAGAGAT
jgi:hypothetical protein